MTKRSPEIANKQGLYLKQVPLHILLQSIHLIGLPITELEKTIRMEAEENPFLDVDVSDRGIVNISNTSISIIDQIDNRSITSSESSDTSDISYIKSFENASRKAFQLDEIPNSFETLAVKRETLYEHLFFQCKADINDERLLTLASYIISEINEDGYFVGNIENFLDIKDYTFSAEEVESLLKMIQRYDPVGVGSRNLKECLSVQLEVFYSNIPNYEVVKSIIIEDLDKVTKKENIELLAKKYNLTNNEISRIFEIIRSLDPKPGKNFSSDSESVVIFPEAIVKTLNNDEISIEFNDVFLPKVSIRQDYIATYRQKIPKEIQGKINTARNIVTTIEYRKEILRKIIELIVNYQKDFILGKVDFIKPITGIQIASELGINASTISRALKDKYIQIPRGILPLKYFLSRETKTTLVGEEISVARVKETIKSLLESEETPLSDEKIANILINKGIKISRRTVAKYRKEIGIPNIYERDKHK